MKLKRIVDVILLKVNKVVSENKKRSDFTCL